MQLEAADSLGSIRRQDLAHDGQAVYTPDRLAGPIPELPPTPGEVAREPAAEAIQVGDPTTRIVVDEVYRLRLASRERMRASFDASEIGLILIGMPGLEKRLARCLQNASRIGLVLEIRPLVVAAVRQLPEQHWAPLGVTLRLTVVKPDTGAVLIRITGGDCHLCIRLVTQIERSHEIRVPEEGTYAVVEATRECLVIGQVECSWAEFSTRRHEGATMNLTAE